MSVEASLAYGQALRRAGREAEALTELRRGLGVSGGKAETAGRVQWEIARTHIAKREFEHGDGDLPLDRSRRPPRPRAMSARRRRTCSGVAAPRPSAEIAELDARKSPPSAEVQYFAKVAVGPRARARLEGRGRRDRLSRRRSASPSVVRMRTSCSA